MLLHGFTGCPDDWQEVVATLPPGSALTPALPGHHPGLPVVDGFEANVDAIAAALRQQLGAPPRGLHLVGYSLGARIALGLLARHRELFARATLIGVNPGLLENAARRERAATDAQWAARLRREGIVAFVDAWERLPLFASQSDLPADRRTRQRRTRCAHQPEALARCLERLGLAAMPDYRPLFGAIDLPLRLVVGERDAKFRAIAREIEDRAQNRRVTVRVVPRCGHNVVLEAPATLARLLTQPQR